eukprot:5575143-Lingulodinium_polyedra.AAC.1
MVAGEYHCQNGVVEFCKHISKGLTTSYCPKLRRPSRRQGGMCPTKRTYWCSKSAKTRASSASMAEPLHISGRPGDSS